MKLHHIPPRGPSHTWETWGSVVAIVAITLFGLIPEAYRGTDWDATLAGQFGDFVGGYFGTVFLVISVGVLVGSYRTQRFTDQVAAFESRFFQLLSYHRDNTTEIEVDSLRGRRAFVSFIREWRLLIPLVREAEVTAPAKVKLSTDEQGILAYLAFYHGSGPNARRTLVEAARDHYGEALVCALIDRMSVDWAIYKKASKDGEPEPEWNPVPTENAPTMNERPLAYTPFEGHHSRLAHYFRHLFHIVKYAADHAPGKTAQEYVDLVRAQLTTHEQVVLALHAASVKGPWKSQNFLQTFHLIKNIPKGFLTEEEFSIRSAFPDVGYADGK